jgi:DNA-binding GntR family transcriptional regulator
MATGTDLRKTGEDRALHAPSLVALAVEAIRKQILSDELKPGERLIEERLTEDLAISRPPLREALRLLENEGLVVSKPRRGSFVATLTDQDVYEILTLRSALERMAFDLGIPIKEPDLLDPARSALEEMYRCAEQDDRGAMVQAGYQFHSGLIKIANHQRLEAIYASVQQQVLLCMSRNLIKRQQPSEDLRAHADRHRLLLELVESGDRDAALTELTAHLQRSFEANPPHSLTAEAANQSGRSSRRGRSAG